ncbi:MAG: sulfurtransferase [Gammaproteobacteria bacterium]|nr:sulfurtransferase [Gammaproteobacteria bacterium]
MYQDLINSGQLEAHLTDENWLIFDCRFDLADTAKGQQQYALSHIPGAFYAHLDQHLSSPITPDTGRHPLPHKGALTAWLGSCGFDGSQQVVVYDDSFGAMATRLWWLLKCLGHDAVALLDGGWQAWSEQGLVVDAGLPNNKPANYTADFNPQCVVTTDQVVQNMASPQWPLIDVRTAERFRGEQEPIDPIAGHIPGALNLPLAQNLDANGFYKSADQLRELYAPLLPAQAPEQTVFMCGSGVTACHSLLALVLAGYPMPRVYAGSWSEWIRDPARPIATASE